MEILDFAGNWLAQTARKRALRTSESARRIRLVDAACRADEKRRADARLKSAYRLAHRRRRNPELRCRSAKAALLGDAQERFHTVERAMPDCEALLHGLSTLSPIVPRGKPPYIGLDKRGDLR